MEPQKLGGNRELVVCDQFMKQPSGPHTKVQGHQVKNVILGLIGPVFR